MSSAEHSGGVKRSHREFAVRWTSRRLLQVCSCERRDELVRCFGQTLLNTFSVQIDDGLMSDGLAQLVVAGEEARMEVK